MKRNQKNQCEFNVKDHEFLITPLSLKSTESIEDGFTLELQKGCKHLKTLPQTINFNHKNTFVFKQTKGITVRAYKQKSMNFSWSLYKQIGDMKQFVDTFQVNFQEDYNSYIEEIRNLHFQYSRIIQQKQIGKEIGRNWNLMKMHLKKHQIRQNLKSSSGMFTLECLITIRNELDRLAETEPQKKIKKSQVDLQQQSTSSLNSRKDKKKVRLIEPERYTEKDQQLKGKSLIKSQSQKLLRPELKANSPEDTTPTDSKPPFSISYLPIGELKSKTILSDIIQASNEGESHLNYGDKTDRKPPSEVHVQSPKSFAKTKTFHFQNTEQTESSPFKRKNSHQSFHREHKMEQQEEVVENEELLKVSEISECSKEQLTKESTIIRQQSSSFKVQNIPRQMSKKYILIILLIYVILGGLLCTQMKDQFKIIKSFTIKGKKSKNDKTDLKKILQAIIK